jgi:hypothetical protein
MEAIVKFRTALLSLESELLYTSGALGAGAEPAQREVKWLLRPLINGESRPTRQGTYVAPSLMVFLRLRQWPTAHCGEIRQESRIIQVPA